MSAPAPARRPLGVLFLTVFIDLVGFGIILPILPTYAKSMGASGIEVGLLFTAYSFMQLVFAPLWGRLSDRVGRRPVLLGSIAGSIVAYVIFGLAGSLPLLFVARAFGGACAANISTAQAYIADVTTPADRAKGMAIIGAGFGLGFTVGPALGGLGTHLFGVRAPFFIAAGLALANLVWAYFALPEPARHERRAPRGLASLGDAFRTRGLAFYLGVFFVAVYAFANIEATFALFNHERHAFGERENGLMFMVIGLTLSAVQGLATRRLVDRIGERRMLVLGTLLIAAGAALLPLIQTWWQLLGPTCLIAAGNAVHSPAIMGLISRHAPSDRQGEMLGVAQSMGALGRITGPAAGGALFDRAGMAWPYVTTAVLMTAIAIAATLRAPDAPPV